MNALATLQAPLKAHFVGVEERRRPKYYDAALVVCGALSIIVICGAIGLSMGWLANLIWPQ